MIQTVHPGSGSRILIISLSRIPDPGVKKAPIFSSRIRNSFPSRIRQNTFRIHTTPCLDLLAEHAIAVHFAHRRLGVLFAVEGDEGETLSRVVHVRHRPESLEFTLVGNSMFRIEHSETEFLDISLTKNRTLRLFKNTYKKIREKK